MSKTDREKAEKTAKSIQREVVWAQGIFKLTGNSVFQAIRHYVEKALKEAKREVLDSDVVVLAIDLLRTNQSIQTKDRQELVDRIVKLFDEYKKEVLGE